MLIKRVTSDRKLEAFREVSEQTLQDMKDSKASGHEDSLS